jgi:hypothetical protein
MPDWIQEYDRQLFETQGYTVIRNGSLRTWWPTPFATLQRL